MATFYGVNTVATLAFGKPERFWGGRRGLMIMAWLIQGVFFVFYLFNHKVAPHRNHRSPRIFPTCLYLVTFLLHFHPHARLSSDTTTTASATTSPPTPPSLPHTPAAGIPPTGATRAGTPQGGATPGRIGSALPATLGRAVSATWPCLRVLPSSP